MAKKTPELRFPKFESNWQNLSLEKVAELTSSKRVFLSDYTKNGIPFYRGKEITELKQGKQPKDILYISTDRYNEYSEKYGIPKEDQILITAVGTLGTIYRIPNNNPFYFKDGNLIWLKEISQDPLFLEHLLDSRKRELLKVSIGSTQKALTIVELNKVQFAFPSFPEQEIIASFLSSVDRRIQLLKEKKEALEKYKAGVMQQIFSQEIRFKAENGSDFPDWEDRRIDDLFDFISTNSLSRDKLNYNTGDHYNIHYGDIHTKFDSHFIFEKEYVPFINQDIDISKFKEESVLKAGDLVIADASEDYNDIGKAIEIIETNNKTIVAGLHTFHAKSKTQELVVGFASHYIKSFNFRLDVMKIAQGTKVLGLSTKRYAELSIKVPHKKEQDRIVSILSNMDIKIDRISTKILSSERFKKGLLQKMFV